MEEKKIPLILEGITESIYAGFWTRLGSMLLDFVFLLPCIIITIYMAAFGKIGLISADIINFIWGLFFNIYLVQKYGGTPGKLIAGIKIIKLNGDDITWKEAIIRHSVLLAMTVFYFAVTITSILSADESKLISLGWQERQMYISTIYPTLMLVNIWGNNIWIYSELIVLLINKRKRAIHDFIAGTVIVKTKYIEQIRDFLNNETSAADN